MSIIAFVLAIPNRAGLQTTIAIVEALRCRFKLNRPPGNDMELHGLWQPCQRLIPGSGSLTPDPRTGSGMTRIPRPFWTRHNDRKVLAHRLRQGSRAVWICSRDRRSFQMSAATMLQHRLRGDRRADPDADWSPRCSQAWLQARLRTVIASQAAFASSSRSRNASNRATSLGARSSCIEFGLHFGEIIARTARRGISRAGTGSSGRRLAIVVP